MTTTATLPDPAQATADPPDLAQRLEVLEAFANQVSGAIDQLVGAVVDVQQARAGETLAGEVQALRTKVRELEQQLSLERSTRDLAQVSRMHPKARCVVFVGTTYFGCNVKYAWAAVHERATALGLQAWFLPYNTEQEALVTGLGGHCLPVGHANWTPRAPAHRAVGRGGRHQRPLPEPQPLRRGAAGWCTPRAAVAWRVDQGDRPAQPGAGPRAGTPLCARAGHLRAVRPAAGHGRRR
jgi:hypothetical protein